MMHINDPHIAKTFIPTFLPNLVRAQDPSGCPFALYRLPYLFWFDCVFSTIPANKSPCVTIVIIIISVRNLTYRANTDDCLLSGNCFATYLAVHRRIHPTHAPVRAFNGIILFDYAVLYFYFYFIRYTGCGWSEKYTEMLFEIWQSSNASCLFQGNWVSKPKEVLIECWLNARGANLCSVCLLLV